MSPADHDRRGHPGGAVALALHVEHLLELARVAASAALGGAGPSPARRVRAAAACDQQRPRARRARATGRAPECLARTLLQGVERGQSSSSSPTSGAVRLRVLFIPYPPPSPPPPPPSPPPAMSAKATSIDERAKSTPSRLVGSKSTMADTSRRSPPTAGDPRKPRSLRLRGCGPVRRPPEAGSAARSRARGRQAATPRHRHRWCTRPRARGWPLPRSGAASRLR